MKKQSIKVHLVKPRRKRKGVHSKKKRPEKKYKGQGR